MPGSKSLSNRLLILDFLSGSHKEIVGLSEARDTRVLKDCLSQIENRRSEESIELDCQDGGTPLRFLMALCALLPGEFVLSGTQRLMSRPMDDLIDALRSMGAKIESLGEDGSGPWLLKGNPELEIDSLEVSFSKSSQFTSALLLVAPFLKKGLRLVLPEQRGSWPYIELTLDVLRVFGVTFKQSKDEIRVQKGFLLPGKLECEADWSSATFFFAMAAIRKQPKLFLKGLNLPSKQGDSFTEIVFRYEGIHCSTVDDGILLEYKKPEWNLNPLSINLSNFPDMSPALVIYFLISKREVDFSGLESLALKESVRDKVLEEVVSSCGASLVKEGELWKLRGTITRKPEKLGVHSDHRMAMAFALLALHFGEISLDAIDCVEKSFPDYWNQVSKLGLSVSN